MTDHKHPLSINPPPIPIQVLKIVNTLQPHSGFISCHLTFENPVPLAWNASPLFYLPFRFLLDYSSLHPSFSDSPSLLLGTFSLRSAPMSWAAETCYPHCLPTRENMLFHYSQLGAKYHVLSRSSVSAWERKKKTEGVRKDKKKDSRKFQNIPGLQEKHLHLWNFTYLYGATREIFEVGFLFFPCTSHSLKYYLIYLWIRWYLPNKILINLSSAQKCL